MTIKYRSFRERLNLFLYDSKKTALTITRYITFMTSLLSLSTVIYFYGFAHTPEEQDLLVMVIRVTLGIFFTGFVVRLLYTSNKVEFLRSNIIESVLMAVLVVEFVSEYLIKFPILKKILLLLDFERFEPWYILAVNFYILVLVGFELVKYSQRILSFSLKPALIFAASFILIIASGTGLLMLPEMTLAGQTTSFIDALFTSVSATCVTGLITLDTATHWTFKGQFIIMLLMQIGALGIVSFASFFAFFVKRGMGIKHQTALQDLLSVDSPLNTRRMLRQIIIYTIIIEFVGGMLIYVLWPPDMVFSSTGQRLFYSAFHSISGFCNAGFSLFSDGLMHQNLQYSYMLQMVFVILIVIGGIGFPAMRELTDRERLRERLIKPWKRWNLSTTVAVYSTVLLIALGTIGYYFLEVNNTLEGHSKLGQVVTSIFQSVTTRTAGFNTVDMSALATPTVIMFVFLMFIGASSGGTGGGIKTSTFFVIILAGYSTIRGKNRLNFQGRTISQALLNKAYTLFVFAATLCLFMCFGLSITDPDKPILKIVFETISAFGTVGLSMGITSSLSTAGKVLIILTMYLGRVGILTLAFALSSPVVSNDYKYPDAHMAIG